VSRLFRLSKSELLLLLEALVLVAAVRVALWLYPYDRVRNTLQRVRGVSKNKPSSARIAQFVSAAGRFVPNANCLTRALAAETLLRWHGYDPSLRIGVSKSAPNGLRAHAWVEIGGAVVIGGDAVDGLTPLQAAGPQPCP
jgi:hypothetical protein